LGNNPPRSRIDYFNTSFAEVATGQGISVATL
jgi:hypothetical protein